MRLLYFYTNNNTACKALEPYLPSFTERIDCEVSTKLVEEFTVTHVPLFIITTANKVEIERYQTTDIGLVLRHMEDIKNAAS